MNQIKISFGKKEKSKNALSHPQDLYYFSVYANGYDVGCIYRNKRHWGFRFYDILGTNDIMLKSNLDSMTSCKEFIISTLTGQHQSESALILKKFLSKQPKNWVSPANRDSGKLM